MSGGQVVGEIVTAEYTNFCAESYRLHQAPALGGLVVADKVIGLVYSAHTEGLGPILRKGKEGGADGEVYVQHPELERTLRTQFTALCVGYYTDNGKVMHIYPNRPPRIHYQCQELDEAAICQFTARPEYLRAAVNSTEPGVDQAIVHLLYRCFSLRDAGPARRDNLLAATIYLSRLLKNQYDRLTAILETLEGLIGEAYTEDEAVVRGVGNVTTL